MAVKSASEATAHRHGVRWWEHDADETSKTANRFEGLWLYGLYLLTVAGLSITALVLDGAPCGVAAADFAAGPAPLPLIIGFRVASALMCIGTLIYRGSTEKEQDEETLDRRPIKMRSHGIWRFQGLTQWQFLLIALYFTSSSVLTISAAAAPLDAAWVSAPSGVACATSTVFGVAFALALLTTVVVTFVLVPAKIKNGTSAAHFFHWDELVMHNANSFLLIFDLVAVGALHVRLADLPWSAVVGVTYTVFHHYIRYPRTRTLLYFFLNWQNRKAPLILLVLISAIVLFFGIGFAVSYYLRPKPWGAPLVLLSSVLIMRLREPAPKPKVT